MYTKDTIAANRDVSFIELNKTFIWQWPVIPAADRRKGKRCSQVPPYIVGRFTTRVTLMEVCPLSKA